MQLSAIGFVVRKAADQIVAYLGHIDQPIQVQIPGDAANKRGSFIAQIALVVNVRQRLHHRIPFHISVERQGMAVCITPVIVDMGAAL